MSQLPCGYSFHDECVKSWLKKRNTCPMCRVSSEVKTSKKSSLHNKLDFLELETISDPQLLRNVIKI